GEYWSSSDAVVSSGLLVCTDTSSASSSAPTSASSGALVATLQACRIGGLLIGHPVVVSTAAGRGPRLLARCRAKSRPAPLGGGEVPRAATGRSPTLRACL